MGEDEVGVLHFQRRLIVGHGEGRGGSASDAGVDLIGNAHDVGTGGQTGGGEAVGADGSGEGGGAEGIGAVGFKPLDEVVGRGGAAVDVDGDGAVGAAPPQLALGAMAEAMTKGSTGRVVERDLPGQGGAGRGQAGGAHLVGAGGQTGVGIGGDGAGQRGDAVGFKPGEGISGCGEGDAVFAHLETVMLPLGGVQSS
jgi:hypothetical protein